MRRVLITGAGGFIGSHLVEDQLRRGRFVTAVDLHTESLAPLAHKPGLKILTGDFADRAWLDPYLPGHHLCYHLASAHLETGVDEDYFWQVNVVATQNFVARCHAARISRFVHCSSVGVYGDIDDPPADEESSCHPSIPYERSKLAGERAVRSYARAHNYPLTVVRPAWVYGPRCPRTSKLFRAIQKQRFFYVGSGNTLRHPLYVSDMIRAFEQVATCQRAMDQEVFIIAGPRAVTLQELVNTIADCGGARRPFLHLPPFLVWPGTWLMELTGKLLGREMPFSRRSMKFFSGNTAFCTQKACNWLGFTAKVDLAEGVARTYEWLWENGLAR